MVIDTAYICKHKCTMNILIKEWSIKKLKRHYRLAYRIILHSLENCPTRQHSTNNHTKAWFSEDDVRSTPCCVGGVCYCNTNISFLQSWGVIYTIPSHTTNVFSCLQAFHNLILVFY